MDHGWTEDDEGGIAVKWLTMKPAPESVLQDLSCKCKRKCISSSCACLQNGFKCSVVCHSFSYDDEILEEADSGDILISEDSDAEEDYESDEDLLLGL